MAEHCAILPFQFCVVIGLFQVHDSLDKETLLALTEIFDAVIVVALVEIAIGFKTLIWTIENPYEVHKNDKTFAQNV